MSIEGQLQFEMRDDRSGYYAVELRSTRPVHAAKVFIGKKADEVLAVVPRLFQICGIAQAGAAAEALQRAAGHEVPDTLAAARAAMIHLETAREHLWRIVVDWAELGGLSPEPRQVRALDALLPELQRTLFTSDSAFQFDSMADSPTADGAIEELRNILALTVFGVDPRDWLALASLDRLEEWSRANETPAAVYLRQVIDAGWQAIGAVDVTPLPAIDDAAIDACLAAPDADAFVALPTWDGNTCETTPLQRSADHALVAAATRDFGAGLMARTIAVLVELASVPERIAGTLADERRPRPVSALAKHTGIGQVEAARGRLVHRAVVAGDIVSDYRILAPTEWNFHPQGTVVRGLSTIPADDPERTRQAARALITTIDPCVGFSLAVH